MIFVKLNFPDMANLVEGFGELNKELRDKVIVRSMNHVGDKVYTRVIRTIAKNTGVLARDVKQSIIKKHAFPDRMVFEIVATGGFFPLSAFKPWQAPGGVSAMPWGRRHVFPGTFFGPGGQVYRRTDELNLLGREVIKKLWGPAIPREMMREEIQKQTNDLMESDFIPRLKHEYDRVISGIKTKYNLGHHHG